MKKHLNTLILKDPDARRQALAEVLDAEGFHYITQTKSPSVKNPRGIVNYIIEPETDSPSILFCAHYDAVPGSFGANDNAASLCILIKLAVQLKELKIPARFAFFDGEENGNAGSQFYVSQANPQQITGVINLDLCGYGDTLAIYGKGNEKKASLVPFCEKKILEKYSGQLVKYLPPSDDVSFAQSGIPTISIAVVPRWDIKFLKAMASYGSGLLGRTPEFDMMVEQMEVTSTIHGGYRDDPEWIDENAMRLVYDYLLEGMLAPPVAKSSLFSFFLK